ncbi:MAG TPA: ribbon-helix-helix domain-containing protein [Candidatus Brocadiia bacterium]|nr:ribbon-helix-helix protein, CopG family [Planctomycetota bacterium]MDO8092258.1 ribbon-helix-helix domain-containing protein [Candidatus Brocadiales bacterium]
MKTAISVPDELFKKIEKIAKEYNYSRSELFTIAAREFIEKIKSRKLLDAINEAYSDVEIEEETSLRRKSKKYYAHKILKERY